MNKINSIIKKWVSVLLIMFLVMFSYFEKTYVVEASSVSWALYYVSGGTSYTQKVVPLYTYGGYYRAHCSGFTGNCTYMVVNIKCYEESTCSTSVPLTKTVRFSTSGNIDFKLNPMPSTPTVYYKVKLSYSGGTTANSSGTIKTL